MLLYCSKLIAKKELAHYFHNTKTENTGGLYGVNLDVMTEGNCALTYCFGDLFSRHMSDNPKSQIPEGELKVMKTPGSTHVLDRKTKKLVKCNKDICPYGIDEEDIGWVNYAPYAAHGGWAGAVNAHASEINQKEVIRFFKFATSEEISLLTLIQNATLPRSESYNQDPFRNSHLNVSKWVDKGYDKSVAQSYLTTVEKTFDSKNIVVDIRFPTSRTIRKIMDNEIYDHLEEVVWNDKGSSFPKEERENLRQSTMASIKERWEREIKLYDNRLNTAIPLKQQYQTDLGIYDYDIQTNHHELKRGHHIAGGVMAATILLTSMVFAAWVFLYRENRAVKLSQPFFLYIICVGTFIMGIAIIPLSIDDIGPWKEMASKACMCVSWLFFVGFTVSFSAIFSKIWRINKLYRSAEQCERVSISTRDVMIPFAVMLCLNVILLLSLTLISPLEYIRFDTDTLNDYGTCSVNSGSNQYVTLFLGAFIILVNVGALVMSNVQAYKARHISDELSESAYIALAMISMLQTYIIGIPLLIVVWKEPRAKYILECGMIFVISMSLLLLIFIPKIRHVHMPKTVKYINQQRKSKKNPMNRQPEAMDSVTELINYKVKVREMKYKVKDGIFDIDELFSTFDDLEPEHNRFGLSSSVTQHQSAGRSSLASVSESQVQ